MPIFGPDFYDLCSPSQGVAARKAYRGYEEKGISPNVKGILLVALDDVLAGCAEPENEDEDVPRKICQGGFPSICIISARVILKIWVKYLVFSLFNV